MRGGYSAVNAWERKKRALIPAKLPVGAGSEEWCT